jgi:hypothetical protein
MKNYSLNQNAGSSLNTSFQNIFRKFNKKTGVGVKSIHVNCISKQFNEAIAVLFLFLKSTAFQFQNYQLSTKGFIYSNSYELL